MTSNNDVALAVLRLYRARLDAERVGIASAPGLEGTLGVDSRKQLNGSSGWGKGRSATLNTSDELDLWGKWPVSAMPRFGPVRPLKRICAPRG